MPWMSVAHLTIQDYTRQRCKTVIIQHTLCLNYDINHRLTFVSLTSFQISQIAESGLVIIIRTPVYRLALEFVHDGTPKEKCILSLYHTLSNPVIGSTFFKKLLPCVQPSPWTGRHREKRNNSLETERKKTQSHITVNAHSESWLHSKAFKKLLFIWVHGTV